MKSRSHQGRSIRPEPPPPRTAARCENPAARPAAKATAGFDLPPLLLLDLRDTAATRPFVFVMFEHIAPCRHQQLALALPSMERQNTTRSASGWRVQEEGKGYGEQYLARLKRGPRNSRPDGEHVPVPAAPRAPACGTADGFVRTPHRASAREGERRSREERYERSGQVPESTGLS
jgi:hypothetical protein